MGDPEALAASTNSGPRSEIDKLKSRIEEEKKNGLQDIKFFPGNVTDATVESFAREVNALLDGKEVEISGSL